MVTLLLSAGRTTEIKLKSCSKTKFRLEATKLFYFSRRTIYDCNSLISIVVSLIIGSSNSLPRQRRHEQVPIMLLRPGDWQLADRKQ